MPETLHKPALDRFVHSVFDEPALDPAFVPAGLLAAVRDGYTMPSELHQSRAWSVWRCFEPNSGREVVIKTAALDTPLSDDEIVERVSAEFEFLSKLSSSRIVKGRLKKLDGCASYLAIDYAGDDDIAYFAANRYRNDTTGFYALLVRAVQAVADLHRHEVVHGDLKPQHFIMNDETPVLVDFGLSANLQSPMRELNTPSCLAGTPGYIAPEIASGRATRHDPRQDVYSLGVTLGRLIELWTQNNGARARRSVARVLQTCTRPDPDERYADARALLADLTRATRPRRPGLIASIAASVGVVATVVVGVLLATAPGPPPTWTDPGPAKPRTLLDLDWTEGHIAAGEARDQFLAAIDALPEAEQTAWEVGLVRHGGETQPFGEAPFGELPALTWRYHHPSGSLAWYSADGRFFHRTGPDAPAVTSPTPMLLGIEFSANGKHAALIDDNLDVYTAALFPDRPVEMDKTPITDARAAYLAGGLVYAMQRITSTIHRWDRAEHTIDEHGYKTALQVHSAAGVVAYLGRDPGGRRVAAVKTIGGEVLLPDTPMDRQDGIIECAEFCAETGRLFLGFDDGTVAIYDTAADRWRQVSCPSEGDVSAVLYVPAEDRLFVASLGIHVFRLSDLKRTVTLGGRLVVNELVTRFAWEPSERAVYVESNLGVARWHAAPTE